MARTRKIFPLFEQVEILDAGSEGKAIARVDNQVVFVPFVVPGDVVDIKVVRKKKSFLEGKAVKFHRYSDRRVEPKCEHFALCGGCKWQNMSYEDQLSYKQKQVVDNFERIGKLDITGLRSILPSDEQYFYRNKLEFTFSDRKWLVSNENMDSGEENMNGLGLHLPGMFDRIVDLNNCYLQPDPSNEIRLAVRDFCLEKNYTFYNTKIHEGFMRNLIIRTSSTGEVMIIVVFAEDLKDQIADVLTFITKRFPTTNSLFFVVNTKWNDVINDLELKLYKGNPYINESMDDLKFKVGPLSFYQTNSRQAEKLYQVAQDFADFKGDEVVYDLYCGTGTITNYIAASVKKAIGIEYIPSAIDDAHENSHINGIENTRFFVGDIAHTLDEAFFEANGKPDVVITDPPRAGMHQKVIRQLVTALPEKIIYVSCNPATQARDIALMADHYKIEKIQPVDMFPQTHHVENVVLLVRKDGREDCGLKTEDCRLKTDPDSYREKTEEPNLNISLK
nr:23S rRNA (uracil(1939)-C(5))-methyltransferase RlmD [Bacteroidota bacterium]